MDALTDQHVDGLVVAAQGGDQDAFRRLVLATQADLRIAIAAHAASAEEVDEALQHTYVAAFEKLSQYRVSRTFRAWLRAIARNHLIDRWRESRRMAALDGAVLDDLLAAHAENTLEHEESLAEAELQTRRLHICLQRLPDRSRRILERRYRDGLGLDVLARQFHQTAESLSVTLFRIRQIMRRCMEDSA